MRQRQGLLLGMTKRRRLVLGFAALGLLVTALTLMTLELDPPSPWIWAPIVLCPPALLSISLIDVEQNSDVPVVVWIVIALINSTLYAGVGAWIGRRGSRHA
jgi:hypothetical protein